MSRLILGGLKLRGLIRRWSMHPTFSTPCLFKLRLPWVLPSLLMMIWCIFFWICISLMMLMLIPHVRCILFWIYNSCKLLFSKNLLKLALNMMIVQKVYYNFKNSSLYHEVVCFQRIPLILIFMTLIYLPFTKSDESLTTICWEHIIYQVKSWLSHLNLGRIH